jgi:cyclic beta-1,2-glucan synthetase
VGHGVSLRVRRGLSGDELLNFTKSLVSGEAAVAMRAKSASLSVAAGILREGTDMPPVIFLLHDKAAEAQRAPRNSLTVFSLGQVKARAESLAAEHRVDKAAVATPELVPRLKSAGRRIREACVELSEAERLGQGTPAFAEWILDNEFVVKSNSRDFLVNLPRGFYRRLPILAVGRYEGFPRIYDLARNLIADNELRVDSGTIIAFLDAYQNTSSLTIGELWALPQMLRLALIEDIADLALRAATELRERENADFWANRLIRATRRSPDQLFAILARLTLEIPKPSPYFAAQLVSHLYDEDSVLVLAQAWLERCYHQPLGELDLKERNRQVKESVSIANALTSLRNLSLLDWKGVFESESRVEILLRREASGVYPGMDFVTRDRYRRSVEELSRASRRSEESVTLSALKLADSACPDNPPSDERLNHVGHYLVGEGRPELVRMLGCGESRRYRALHWLYRQPTAFFSCGIGLLGLASLFLILVGLSGQGPGACLVMALLAVLPASQLALESLSYLAVRLLPARALPKMDYSLLGIPDQFRTLVVVPVLLGDEASIRADVGRLEVRYLANKEGNLLYGLFTDYRDADKARLNGDEALLAVAISGIEELDRRYGPGRFLLFHRERTWSESEGKYIGWERKRGKLEELNAAIAGRRSPGEPSLVRSGDAGLLAGVRFVITLDSDTQLPLGSARRLVETLAHPLNRPRLAEGGKAMAGGYTIIQPRVSTAMPSARASVFSRLFADASGIDPYSSVASDLYQDLAGEGSYYGKGIYDVRAFDSILGGRFPEGRLLSHDLIEGAHVRVGLASDIELYDEFPRSYATYANRQRRWIRGDWQIAQWASPMVPAGGAGLGPNPLSRLDRWKLFDNLRRSLLPVADMALLVASWAISPRASLVAAIVVVLQLFARPIARPFTMLTTRLGFKAFSPRLFLHDALRALADAALLPHQAVVALDSIFRAAYRTRVSHRNMLQWASAQSLSGGGPERPPLFAQTIALVAAVGAATIAAIAGHGAAAAGLARLAPESLMGAAPWLVAWALSPLVAWMLSLAPRLPHETLPESDKRFLFELSRRTWRYFDDLVGAETAWLPPDNYQVSPKDELALRTSPTNIGLWMTSVVAARDFGYLTVDQAIERLELTMESIGGLEKFRGHLLNWYDLRTRLPLEPRYVSSVDSGNFLASLWATEQGLLGLSSRPVLDASLFRGLSDTVRVLGRILGRGGRSMRSAPGKDKVHREPIPRYVALGRLMADLSPEPQRAVGGAASLGAASEGAVGAIGRIDCAMGDLIALREARAASARTEGEEGYWIGRLEGQLAAAHGLAARYLEWMRILAERPIDGLSALYPGLGKAVQAALSAAPSLSELAEGRVSCIPMLEMVGESALDEPTREWLGRVLAAFSTSRWLAGEALGRLDALVRGCRSLSEGIDIGFLYDPERRLFSIGYDATEGRRAESFYDLLASESRLGSFVAIARGDVPPEHWFALGRPYTIAAHRSVLLSWTGTMFEYLMPFLLQDPAPGTLLNEAAFGAIAAQMEYGRQNRVPWGASESAFADLDIDKIYQYRAFGVPSLGLKRLAAEKVVIAPYASFLALGFEPRKTILNLRRLASLGLLDDFGYYDAIDFSRQPGQIGGRGVVAQVYMAHHQGMSFLALANQLMDGSMRSYFRSDPRVRAALTLLYERIPLLPASRYIPSRDLEQGLGEADDLGLATSQFESALTRTPKTQLLSNGRYSLMISNSGGGYSRWGEKDITRWRSDPTKDCWGTFIYIHDRDSCQLMSPTYQPLGLRGEACSAHFFLDHAVFDRLESGIESHVEIVLSPEDDVEIRRVTLTNRSLRYRRLECTSYVELAMAAHAADRQHPAFSKLFIRTELLPLQRALIASRRQREGEGGAIFVAHRLTVESEGAGALRFETDRAAFIGRGHSLADPLGAIGEPGCGQGYVLDPILSIRTTIALAPGQRTTFSLVVSAGETREGVVGLMEKYSDPRAIDRAFDFAWAAAQLELRVLHIRAEDAKRFQQLASHLVYPSRFLRAPAERIEDNALGQAGLWRYGISGDLPIALVTIGDLRDMALAGQMLQAHEYWRMRGLWVDLVILARESEGYERPLRERLEGLIRAHSANTGRDKPGGVFLRDIKQMPEADQDLIMAVSSIALVAARGSLLQQLGAPVEPEEAGAMVSWEDAPHDEANPLPFLELPYFNGMGGFTPDGREYAIYLGEGENTPAPWVNVISNPGFGALVGERGSLFAWEGNSQRNRLTSWSNDPVVDPVPEALYIRDEDTGRCWTPTASPMRGRGAYRARHGAGYSVFEHNSGGIEAELSVFVPMDAHGGKPVKLQLLRLMNSSSRRRSLSLTYYVELILGENAETSRMQVVTAWDEELGAILARNRYRADYGESVAFVALGSPADFHSGDRGAFLGRGGSMSLPAAMGRRGLNGHVGSGYDPCAALRLGFELAPGEEVTLSCMLGEAASAEGARGLIRAFREEGAPGYALAETKAWWDGTLGAITVHTPELSTDFLINRWLLYQDLSCRVWGRSAFYQSGGAFGFRDQLQDVMALVYTAPGIAREQILLAASRQFREGDVQHWWHPPVGAGIRSRISDDLLWLPFAVGHYLRVTGDVAILSERVSFLEGPLLEDGQREAFFTPTTSQESANLLEHCRRAVERGLTEGQHGLPLMGTGDWNDGMNSVGARGKGESVWLGWFLADVLLCMSEITAALGLSEAGGGYLAQRKALLGRIEAASWDGEWYLRAISDEGAILGSRNCAEARIDSLPQSWAVLSGGDAAKSRQALDSAWRELVRKDDGIALLFSPPFDASSPSPGYIQAYPPGVRENGGQYTHAAIWLAMATARLGDGARAVELLDMLNPVEHSRDPKALRRYAAEPYAIAADVYALPGRVGQGGWSWYSGSAAWMYRAWVEEILGFKLRGESLSIEPVIPGWWSGFSIDYLHGEARYSIKVENPDRRERGILWVEVDGKRLSTPSIALERGLGRHDVRVRMGAC